MHNDSPTRLDSGPRWIILPRVSIRDGDYLCESVLGRSGWARNARDGRFRLRTQYE